jgi:transposase
MAISSDARDQLALKFEVLSPHLNERQRRLLLGAEARLLGHGGVRAVAQVAGVSETTVRRGVFELEEGQDPFPDGRARREGGGRRSTEELDAGLVPALLALVEPDERGDPESPLRWTTKSLRHLAGELARQGHPVSAPTVGRLLRGAGFSLQANAKTLEGVQHPDRDAQFRYINEQVKDHQAGGEPVISVDTKKYRDSARVPAPRIRGRADRARGNRRPRGGGGLVLAAIQFVRVPGLRASRLPDCRRLAYLAIRGLNDVPTQRRFEAMAVSRRQPGRR